LGKKQMKLFERLFNRGKTDFDALVAQSEEELRVRTAAHDGAWRLAEADWHIDQDVGAIEFTRQDGFVARAPVQIIGTFNVEDRTWLWAWDNSTILPALRKHAEIVHEYGTKNGLERLTARKFKSNEEEAWSFAAVACKLADAQGAYCGPADCTRVFVTFGDVTLRQR
jgi:hypothetical protein